MVELKTLGEITTIIRGNRVTKADLVENGEFPVISGGINPLGYIDKTNREPNTITIAQYGTAGYVNIQRTKFWANDVCYSVYPKEGVHNEYLYYALMNVQGYIYSLKTNAVPAHLPLASLQEVQIPIPSKEEQTRIVEILDTFTNSIANLKEQIQTRRKQYEYYRDQLLSLEGKEGYNIIPMKDLGTLTRGKRFVRDDVRETGQPCIHYGDLYTHYGIIADKAKTYLDRDFPKKMRYAKKGDVVIVGAGENDWDIGIGMVWNGEEPAVVHDACYILQHQMNSKYISYYLRSACYHLQIKKYVSTGKICSISAEGIGKALISVPSLAEQQRIVDILDQFEASISNLEAQLKQREKQYEYYRNQLLDFKKKEE